MRKALLLIFGCFSYARAYTLRQLHVVTRHGARYPLVKDADTLEERTMGELTTHGIQEQKNLGIFLNETYRLSYDSNKVRFESSSIARTMESALALADGLYGRSVPVYSSKVENDVTIRAYDKCPTFQKALQELYESDLWTEKEQENIWLLNHLANLPPFAEYASKSHFIYLEDVWNIYDLIFVASQCHVDCPPILKLANESGIAGTDWLQIQNLAHFAELEKYKRGGKLLGANLLDLIISRMENINVQVYLYSGHYPTILGVLNTLGKMNVVEDVIPPFASAVVFEVYEENMMVYVSVKYKPGDGASFKEVPLCDGTCSLNDFQAYIRQRLSDMGEWCEACGNTEADICLKKTVEQLSMQTHSCPISEPLWMLAVGYVTALLCVGVAYLALKKRSKKPKTDQPPESPKELELTESSVI